MAAKSKPSRKQRRERREKTQRALEHGLPARPIDRPLAKLETGEVLKRAREALERTARTEQGGENQLDRVPADAPLLKEPSPWERLRDMPAAGKVAILAVLAVVGFAILAARRDREDVEAASEPSRHSAEAAIAPASAQSPPFLARDQQASPHVSPTPPLPLVASGNEPRKGDRDTATTLLLPNTPPSISSSQPAAALHGGVASPPSSPIHSPLTPIVSAAPPTKAASTPSKKRLKSVVAPASEDFGSQQIEILPPPPDGPTGAQQEPRKQLVVPSPKPPVPGEENPY